MNVIRVRYAAGLLGAIGAAILLPVSANAATRTVTLGEAGKDGKKIQATGSSVNDYFPHVTTIHAGDKVKFVPSGFHSVEFPPKGADPAQLLVPNGSKVTGENDAAGQPFWFNGLDNFSFNPVVLKSKFGKKVTYNAKKGLQSGIPLGPSKPMTVKFPRAGKFVYYCTVHAGMTGQVKVVKKGKRVPSNTAHKAKVKAQYKRDLKIAKALPKVNVPAGVVDVGVAGKHGVEYFGMVPASVTIPSGTGLQFRMTKGSYEAHTATFGPGNPQTEPNSYLGKIASTFEGAPQIDPKGIYPSEPPTTTAVLTPSLHGNGFWNSGVMDTVAGSAPPGNNTVTFGSASGVYHVPGTYTYYCLIHPFMHGQVVVK